MNQAELQTSTEGYSIATGGDIASFEGKAFVKEILNTTSMEMSFGTLAPGCTVPFFHHHKQNESPSFTAFISGRLALANSRSSTAWARTVLFASRV